MCACVHGVCVCVSVVSLSCRCQLCWLFGNCVHVCDHGYGVTHDLHYNFVLFIFYSYDLKLRRCMLEHDGTIDTQNCDGIRTTKDHRGS